MMPTQNLRPLVGDMRQVASTRRVVLDDGPERGVHAIIFSTGGGLDFWVIEDSCFDIGQLMWRGLQIGWQSPAGFRSPMFRSADGDNGFGFNRAFSGFLATCGLDHIRQPTNGKPLHGHFPGTPGRLVSHGADWNADEPYLFCEGLIVQWRYGAETLVVNRRIEAPVGQRKIRVRDTVENVGPETCAVSTLYHFNLGYPLVRAGTEVTFNGVTVVEPINFPDLDGLSPPKLHPASAPDACCSVMSPTGLRMRFQWRAEQLPFLQIWRDLRPRCGVLSIEPCNVGRVESQNATPPIIEPGRTMKFDIDIDIDASEASTNRQSGGDDMARM